MTTFSHDPIAQLWQGARAWFAELSAEFGPASQIAALARAARAALACDLRVLEALVMKLLLIEAMRALRNRFKHCSVAAEPAPMGEAHASAAQTAGVRRALASAAPAAKLESPPLMDAVTAHPDRQDERPATFVLRLPHAARSRRRSAGPRPQRQSRFADLARRCEALRRVLANPAPAIARLACKLHALAARAYAVARRIALHRPRGEPRDPMLFAHACVCAHDALEASG